MIIGSRSTDQECTTYLFDQCPSDSSLLLTIVGACLVSCVMSAPTHPQQLFGTGVLDTLVRTNYFSPRLTSFRIPRLWSLLSPLPSTAWKPHPPHERVKLSQESRRKGMIIRSTTIISAYIRSYVTDTYQMRVHLLLRILGETVLFARYFKCKYVAYVFTVTTGCRSNQRSSVT
jgi:hypothetical protein